MHLSKAPITELEAGVRGLTADDVKEETKIVSAYLHVPPRDTPNLPLVQPIYATSAWKFSSVKDFQAGMKGEAYIYSRVNNPTVNAAEAAINLIEGGKGSVCFPSGTAAAYAGLCAFLKAGDHVVASFPMYLGNIQIVKWLARSGIEYTFVEHTVEEFEKATKPNTRVYFVENPTELDAIDVEGLVQLAQSVGNIVTIVDASLVSPICFKPIKFGIDISFHTATKYLGGHNDLLGGVLTARTTQQYHQILAVKRLLGSIMSPFDAFLLQRGIQTLPLRMQRICESAGKVVAFLDGHPLVERLYYPGLKSFRGHEFAKKQMKGYGGRLVFILKGGKPAGVAFVDNLRLLSCYITYGGSISMCEHSCTQTYGPVRMSDDERRENKIEDGQVRMSVGLEDPEDIINELKHCLGKVAEICGL